jgi:hypothetical protein
MANGLHNVLEAACKALKVDPAPWDAEAKPVLYNPTYVALVVWMIEQVTPKLTPKARAALAKILPAARRVIERKPLDKKLEELVEQVPETPSSDELAIVSAVAGEILECVSTNPAGKGSRAVAVAAAKLLGPTFLGRLAAEIDRLDAVTFIERQELAIKGTIKACAWRGTAGAKLTHVIVELDDGSFGLIAKTKGRWTWEQGPRDDMLASVPDAYMESAVQTVVGGGGKTAKGAAPAAKTKEKATAAAWENGALAGRLTALAIGPDGRIWAASNDALAEWTASEMVVAGAKIGAIAGIDAGTGGVVATWGAAVTRWRDLVPSFVAHEEADGALVMPDGTIAWWNQAALHFGKKKVPGHAGQSISQDRAGGRVLALGPSGALRVFAPSGALQAEVSLVVEAAAKRFHALAPDGRRLATWVTAPKSRKVEVFAVDDGTKLLTLTVDSGTIDSVVFAGDDLFVRYHDGKRVAIFDARGKQTSRVQARELGARGASVDVIFPLGRGQILGFSPFPRGDVILVDAGAQLVARWELENFYSGGKSYIAEGGGRVCFAHRHRRTRLTRF